MSQLHENDKNQTQSKAAANSPNFQQEGITSCMPPQFKTTTGSASQMKKNEEGKVETLQKKENNSNFTEGDASVTPPNSNIKNNAYRSEPKQFKAYQPSAQKKTIKQFKQDKPFQLKKSPTDTKSQGGLPQEVQAKMENSMGHDFSNVNIHQNSKNATDAGALAYAQGNDVHFAPGQFKPHTTSGQELIGHELAHVVQQREGRVKPTRMLGKGMAVNDDPALEQEADNMGKKAARDGSENSQLKKKSTANNKPLQLSSSCEKGCGCNNCTTTTQLKAETIQRSAHDQGCGCGDCNTLQLKKDKTLQRQTGSGEIMDGVQASPKEEMLEKAKEMTVSWDVRKIQESLNELGFNCGTADGMIGTKTTDAIKAFQQKVKINDDGVAGKTTKAYLYIEVANRQNKAEQLKKKAEKEKGPKTILDSTWLNDTWLEDGWNSSANAMEAGWNSTAAVLETGMNKASNAIDSIGKSAGELMDYLNPFKGDKKNTEKKAGKNDNKDPYLKYLEENDYKTYKKDMQGNDKTFTIQTGSTSEKAYLRTMTEKKDGTRTFESTSKTIALGTVVKITDIKIDNTISRKTFAKVSDAETGKELGWTSSTNFKGKLDGELMGITKGNIESREPGHCTIFDAQAYLRKEVDGKEGKIYESSSEKVARGTYVKVTKSTAKAQLKNSKGSLSTGSVVKIKKVTKKGEKYVEGADLGWTAASNLVDGFQKVDGQDTKSLTSMWVKGKYAGQTDIVDMVTPDGRRQITKNAGVAPNILKLFKDAGEANIQLSLNSGYRDYNKQVALKKQYGANAATAGCSKHQSGRAYDLNNKRSPEAYDWLKKNAYKYGIVQNLPYYGGEGHHWSYAPNLAKAGYYTYFGNAYSPFSGSTNSKLKFGTGKGEVDPRVKSTENWMTGNSGGAGKGKFRITESGKAVKLRIEE